MIVVNCAQGSPEWHVARAGVITASMFREVRRRVGGLTDQQQVYVAHLRAGEAESTALEAAGYKAKPKSDVLTRALAGEQVGDFSSAAKDYAFRLAVERISGGPIAGDSFETFAMRRGHELEPEAREAHSFQIDATVQQTGIVLTDDCKFGASADGLIGDDGGSEYKCFIAPDSIRDIVLGQDISEYLDQIQGCMWLTDRKWWHFCLYCPALAPIGKSLTVFEVKRDDDYIDAMQRDLLAFDNLVCEYENALRKKVAA